MTQQVRSIHLNLRGIAPGQILSDAIGRLATWSLPSLYNKVVIGLFEKDYDDRVHSQPSLIAEYSDTLRGETCLGYALWKEKDREYEFRSGSPRDRMGNHLDGFPEDGLDKILDAVEMAMGITDTDANDEDRAEPRQPDTKKLRSLYVQHVYRERIDELFKIGDIDKAQFGL